MSFVGLVVDAALARLRRGVIGHGSQAKAFFHVQTKNQKSGARVFRWA